jgi:hypothetical protein
VDDGRKDGEYDGRDPEKSERHGRERRAVEIMSRSYRRG